MFTPPVPSITPIFPLPTAIWLEDEHFDDAKVMSKQCSGEENQWQTYLDTLALLSFKQWLQEQLPEQAIDANLDMIEHIGHLSVGEFKIGVIATESLLDEVLQVLLVAVHFYAVIEIVEEQEQALIRGILRYDELLQHQQHYGLRPSETNRISLPLDLFNLEPSRLLSYCRFLEPASIPVSSNARSSEELAQPFRQITTKLTAWLQGELAQGWQAIDTLINSQTQLALSPRNPGSGRSNGKLINLELQLGHQAIVLLVSITPQTSIEFDADEKFSILVQLHPTEGERYLLPHLKLLLRSRTETVLQEVISRDYNDYIQLRPFRGTAGIPFHIEVCIHDCCLRESFEI